jgi:hypothetical protein
MHKITQPFIQGCYLGHFTQPKAQATLKVISRLAPPLTGAPAPSVLPPTEPPPPCERGFGWENKAPDIQIPSAMTQAIRTDFFIEFSEVYLFYHFYLILIVVFTRAEFSFQSYQMVLKY